MALGKKPVAVREGQKESKFVTIMRVLRGKPRDGETEGNEYVQADNYKGRLLWQAYGKGDTLEEKQQNSKCYEILKGFIGTPHESAPEFVLQTIVINLNNETNALPLG